MLKVALDEEKARGCRPRRAPSSRSAAARSCGCWTARASWAAAPCSTWSTPATQDRSGDARRPAASRGPAELPPAGTLRRRPLHRARPACRRRACGTGTSSRTTSGSSSRADRSWQLMLFDFSLADASERDINAGTRGYLDPFLGTARRPRSTTTPSATRRLSRCTRWRPAQRPVWGDGIDRPPHHGRRGRRRSPRSCSSRRCATGSSRSSSVPCTATSTAGSTPSARWRPPGAPSSRCATPRRPATTPTTVGLEPPPLEATRDAHAAAADARHPAGRGRPVAARGLRGAAVRRDHGRRAARRAAAPDRAGPRGRGGDPQGAQPPTQAVDRRSCCGRPPGGTGRRALHAIDELAPSSCCRRAAARGRRRQRPCGSPSACP